MNLMNQTGAAQSMQAIGVLGHLAGQNQYSAQEIKGAAVDSINTNIGSLTRRMDVLTQFAARISDGLLGVSPPALPPASAGPVAVTQSTQDHIRDLEAAFERLSSQVNRLG
jgi:hypothetical protein